MEEEDERVLMPNDARWCPKGRHMWDSADPADTGKIVCPPCEEEEQMTPYEKAKAICEAAGLKSKPEDAGAWYEAAKASFRFTETFTPKVVLEMLEVMQKLRTWNFKPWCDCETCKKVKDEADALIRKIGGE